MPPANLFTYCKAYIYAALATIPCLPIPWQGPAFGGVLAIGLALAVLLAVKLEHT